MPLPWALPRQRCGPIASIGIGVGSGIGIGVGVGIGVGIGVGFGIGIGVGVAPADPFAGSHVLLAGALPAPR